jgi:hypothetical protein
MSTSQLKRVVCRDVRTHYTISEMLECGHRYESLALLADPLIAKRRACPKCCLVASPPPKKPAISERAKLKRAA